MFPSWHSEIILPEFVDLGKFLFPWEKGSLKVQNLKREHLHLAHVFAFYTLHSSIIVLFLYYQLSPTI